jgi:hypothetical protein
MPPELAPVTTQEAERQWIEQLVDECVRARLEPLVRGVAELRAQLRNEISASEARSAWHMENRDKNLAADLDRRLAALGSRLDHIHQVTMAARITAAAKLVESLS